MSYLHIRSIYTRYLHVQYTMYTHLIFTRCQPEITSVRMLSLPTTAQMHIDTSTHTYVRHLVCSLLPTHFHTLSHSNFIILYYLYDICSIISCKLVNLLHKRMNRSDEKATKPYTKHKHVIRLF